MKHLGPEQLEQAAKTAPEGELAAHLSSCAECRADVKRARARQKLLGGLKPYTLSDAGFRRVEARLDEAVREGLPSAFPWRWLGFGAATLAAAGIALMLVSAPPSTSGVVTLPAQKVELARSEFRPLTVIRADGAQARAGDADWRALSAGDVLQSGEALSAELITLSDAAAEWRFVASGSLSLGGVATVTLGAGEVTTQVESRDAVTVLASSRGFIAKAALFSVTRVGAEVVLQVSEGEVEVVDSLSAQRRVVKAPNAVRWSDGSAVGDGRDEPVRAVGRPRVPAPPWATFDASSLPAGTAITLDDVDLGVAPFTELLSAGRHRLVRNGAAVTIELLAGAPYVATLKDTPSQVEAPEPDAAALERVLSELKRQKPKLAACYEKWLKANPQAGGEVVLQLTVSAQGRVKAARIGSGSMSPASADCLVRASKSLVLSPLGAEATLEVPLMLRRPGP